MARKMAELRLTKAIKSHARMTTTTATTTSETTIINTKCNYNKNVSTKSGRKKKSQLKMFIAFCDGIFESNQKSNSPSDTLQAA